MAASSGGLMYVADHQKQIKALQDQLAQREREKADLSSQVWSERNRANSASAALASLQAQVSTAASTARTAILSALGIGEADIGATKSKLAWYNATQPGYTALVERDKANAAKLAELTGDYDSLKTVYEAAKKSLSDANAIGGGSIGGGSIAATDYTGGSSYGGLSSSLYDSLAANQDTQQAAAQAAAQKPSIVPRLLLLGAVAGGGYWLYKKAA